MADSTERQPGLPAAASAEPAANAVDDAAAAARRERRRDPTGPTIPLEEPGVLKAARSDRAVGPDGTLEKGQRLGRYVIVDLLGKGGMGVVYKAYDPDLDRRVALKVLGDEMPEPRTAEPRFLREAQALAQLSHANVVAVYDVGVVGRQVFIAMELVEGKTIRSWLKARPRTRSEILDVFGQAGRGLEAAHEAGLVHRDFKPGNAIVGDDGRVRVLDFGLARVAREGESVSDTSESAISAPEESSEEPSAVSGAASRSVTAGRMLDAPLTVAGTRLGTPAYMSPEQFERRPATERSDQFSFCVALYEALYGARPYAQAPRHDREARAIAGRVDPPPEGSRVPARLRRIVLKGLAPKPEDRWPSMAALIAELEHDPSRRWRRIGLGALVVGAFAFGALGILRPHGARTAACGDPTAALAGVWDDGVKGRVRTAFQAAAGPYGGEAYERVGKILDGYASRWAHMQGEACRATRELGIQSDSLLDLRTACLARRRGALGALAGSFAVGDATTVTHAVEAAYALEPIEPCADVAGLLATAPLPSDPAARTAIADAHHTMDAAGAHLAVLDGPGTLALLAPLADPTRKTGYAPLRAEYLRLYARAQAETPHAAAGAEATYYEALAAAADAKDDRLVASDWIELLGHIGFDRERPAEGLALRHPAELAVARAGHEPQLEADLDFHLAHVLWGQGRWDEARAHAEAALEAHHRLHGEEHPDVASDLSLLASILSDSGDYAAARGYQERALAVREAVLGPDHPNVADSLDNLGVVDYHEGDLDRALARYQRAFEIRERVEGPDHPDVGTSLNNLGGVFLDQGKLDEAQRAFERSLAIWEVAFGKEAPALAVALDNLGDVSLARGRWDEARGRCERALALEAPKGSETNPNLAFHLTCMGEAWLGAGDAARALPLLERALAIREPTGGDPTDLARTKFALAQALWGLGRGRVRALALAHAAEDAFAAAKGPHALARRDDVSHWLAAHGAN